MVKKKEEDKKKKLVKGPLQEVAELLRSKKLKLTAIENGRETKALHYKINMMK